MASERLAKRRRINASLATVLCTFGLGMTAYGITLATDPVVVESHTDDYVNELLVNCLNATGDVYEAGRTGQSIIATGEKDDDPYGMIAKSARVIEQCDGLTLQSYCLGEDCEENYLSFTLSLAGENE